MQQARSWHRFVVKALLAFSLAAASYSYGQVASDRAMKSVIVELFTSESCSSCPAADTWLSRLATAQPIASVRIIALSEHIDYFNRSGWSDPMSSPLFTSRQAAYVARLHLGGPYTPQLIVEGNGEVDPSHPADAVEEIRRAASVIDIPVRLSSLKVERGQGTTVTGDVQIGTPAESLKGDIYVAVALKRTSEHIFSGENAGRTLSYTGTVLGLSRVGRVRGDAPVRQDFIIHLKANIEPFNLEVVAFVQKREISEIVGATVEDPAPQ